MPDGMTVMPRIDYEPPKYKWLAVCEHPTDIFGKVAHLSQFAILADEFCLTVEGEDMGDAFIEVNEQLVNCYISASIISITRIENSEELERQIDRLQKRKRKMEARK